MEATASEWEKAARPYIHRTYSIDKRLLGSMTWLSRFASIRVFAIDKTAWAWSLQPAQHRELIGAE